MRKSVNLECLQCLPQKEEVFVCIDPGRKDIYGEPMDEIHIDVRMYPDGVWYFCYGYIGNDPICFGCSQDLEEACEVIKSLVPYEEFKCLEGQA